MTLKRQACLRPRRPGNGRSIKTGNEDLVAQVREVAANLSAVVESLLAEYLIRSQRRAAQLKLVESHRGAVESVCRRSRFLLQTNIRLFDGSSSTSTVISGDIGIRFRSSLLVPVESL